MFLMQMLKFEICCIILFTLLLYKPYAHTGISAWQNEETLATKESKGVYGSISQPKVYMNHL